MHPERDLLTVDRRLTHATRATGPFTTPLRLWRGQLADGTPAHSAAITGPCLVRYDPARPVGGRYGLAVITAGEQVIPLPPETALTTLATLEAQGRPAFVHVNTHRANADRRTGTVSPIVAVRIGRWGRPTYVYAVAIHGPSWLLCCPARPLCGAKVYLVVPASTRLRLIGHPPR
jgi:hypothetical protein